MSAYAQHPHPQPMPMLPSAPTQINDTVAVATSVSPLPAGSNKLPYKQSNIFDSLGVELPNTLPSKPGVQFNLLAEPVKESQISKASPKDDLKKALTAIRDAAKQNKTDAVDVQLGLDILEGNPLAGKAYSGFALLHYTGPEKFKRVQPILNAAGQKIGGNVNVHQIWYDNHIESDTCLIDPSDVQDVPWTVTYTVDVLNGGADDFAPFVMYFDAKNPMIAGMLPPLVAMDQVFYPMGDGKRYEIKVKESLGRYFNLTYHWGWRMHPPRAQVMENSTKMAGGKSLLDWETSVFGAVPRSSEASKLKAIAQIGELAPAKRMWQSLRTAGTATPAQVVKLMDEALQAFEDWSDRTRLPKGVQADPGADVTLFYVNNTIYGNATKFTKWTGRGAVFKATVLNGDHFVHGYMNVDFGGERGWENQFETTSGPGASHTFGRVYWWINAGGPAPFGPINIPPVDSSGNPSRQKIQITLNHDGPERIKLYQFDPLHHDVAIYSLH